jgi:hypothetical protein
MSICTLHDEFENAYIRDIYRLYLLISGDDLELGIYSKILMHIYKYLCIVIMLGAFTKINSNKDRISAVILMICVYISVYRFICGLYALCESDLICFVTLFFIIGNVTKVP